jgi:hypothetical protein
LSVVLPASSLSFFRYLPLGILFILRNHFIHIQNTFQLWMTNGLFHKNHVSLSIQLELKKIFDIDFISGFSPLMYALILILLFSYQLCKWYTTVLMIFIIVWIMNPHKSVRKWNRNVESFFKESLQLFYPQQPNENISSVDSKNRRIKCFY